MFDSPIGQYYSVAENFGICTNIRKLVMDLEGLPATFEMSLNVFPHLEELVIQSTFRTFRLLVDQGDPRWEKLRKV